jgi:hypothetical protein
LPAAVTRCGSEVYAETTIRASAAAATHRGRSHRRFRQREDKREFGALARPVARGPWFPKARLELRRGLRPRHFKSEPREERRSRQEKATGGLE